MEPELKANVARPFLKWAGGKTQLLNTLASTFPKKFRTFYEPFVGGGSVFFRMAAEKRFEKAVLNDSNRELMAAYTVLQDNVGSLLTALSDHQAQEWNTSTYFESVRLLDAEELCEAERAARLLYLNRTCFNGLYRVNQAGKFNVPFANYVNPTLINEANLRACSEVLREKSRSKYRTTLLCGDFVDAVKGAGPKDFVYFDPPYLPLSPTSSFAAYTSGGFSESDHYRLAALFKELAAKGVPLVMSNSDTPLALQIYAGFPSFVVQAKRNINSKGGKRGPIGERIFTANLPDLSQETEG